jgi:hypothetical protein
MSAPLDIELETVVARSDKLLHSDVDGDVTMMSVENGKYYGLSSVGARIWTLLEHPASAGQVCLRLMREYRVERARCESDVLTLFRTMADEGVVVVVGPDS